MAFLLVYPTVFGNLLRYSTTRTSCWRCMATIEKMAWYRVCIWQQFTTTASQQHHSECFMDQDAWKEVKGHKTCSNLAISSLQKLEFLLYTCNFHFINDKHGVKKLGVQDPYSLIGASNWGLTLCLLQCVWAVHTTVDPDIPDPWILQPSGVPDRIFSDG